MQYIYGGVDRSTDFSAHGFMSEANNLHVRIQKTNSSLFLPLPPTLSYNPLIRFTLSTYEKFEIKSVKLLLLHDRLEFSYRVIIFLFYLVIFW